MATGCLSSKNHLTSSSCDLKIGALISWKRYQRKVTLKSCWQKTLSRTLLSVQKLMTKNSSLDAYFSTKTTRKPIRIGITPIKQPTLLFVTEFLEETGTRMQDIWKMQTKPQRVLHKTAGKLHVTHSFVVL